MGTYPAYQLTPRFATPMLLEILEVASFFVIFLGVWVWILDRDWSYMLHRFFSGFG